MERSRSDALRARCVFLQYSIFACAHLGGSSCGLPKRPKWSTYAESEVIGVESLCLEGLVDYSIQAEAIIIYLCSFQGTFACVFRQFCCLFARHDVKWRRCISTLRSIDIMTQVCYEGTHLGAQHILDPANNSPWARHTVVAMLAIWDHPQSWAHLATLPFPKPEGFGRRSKDMLDAYDLIPFLWHTLVQVGLVPHLPQPSVCAFSAVLSNFPHFLPAVHHVQPPRARRTHGPMDHI